MNSTLQADQVLLHPRTTDAEAPARNPRNTVAAAPASAGKPLQLFVSHDLGEVEQEWRRFEQYADCTGFQSFDWLATWQKHVGASSGASPAVVIGRTSTGGTVFILPLATSRANGVSQLTFLGRDLCDYNAPLLAPDFASLVGADFPALWQEIRARLQRDPRHRHDLVRLDKMPERIGAQANPFTQLDVNLNPSGAYLTALTGTWDTFYAAKRSSATRRRDRTKRKRLTESGEVRLVTPEAADDIAATLNTLIAQKQRSFVRMGVADIFSRPGWRDFFLDLATNPRTRGLVHVSRLEVGSTLAAANFGLVFRDGYYHVLASYDDGPLSKFGPGAAHLHDIMRHALERGCTFFDFTIGDEPYKRDWSDTELKLYDHFAASSLRGWMVAAPLAAALRLKRSIKQSTWLWPLVQRLRAAWGGLKTHAPDQNADATKPSDAGSEHDPERR